VFAVSPAQQGDLSAADHLNMCLLLHCKKAAISTNFVLGGSLAMAASRARMMYFWTTRHKQNARRRVTPDSHVGRSTSTSGVPDVIVCCRIQILRLWDAPHLHKIAVTTRRLPSSSSVSVLSRHCLMYFLFVNTHMYACMHTYIVSSRRVLAPCFSVGSFGHLKFYDDDLGPWFLRQPGINQKWPRTVWNLTLYYAYRVCTTGAS
jgi:hypothetical protein